LLPASAAPAPHTARPHEPYSALVARLSRQSVAKHFDAYGDIAWDDPAHRIDSDDPRWELQDDSTLAHTDWYRSQPAPIRSRIGLHMVASSMKVGLQFESVLKRGLLEFAAGLPNGSPEFRYIYHEVIEEAQHGLMFQEFVNRTGFDVPGLTGLPRFGARRVVQLGHHFPELFFFFVLGGEDPIDHVQQMALRNKKTLHPLLRRIMQIHVTEEARHLCFARRFLLQRVPQLGPARRAALATGAPLILGTMAQLMMQPPRHIIRTYAIPGAVVRQAYTDNPQHRQKTCEALRKVRQLCVETGLITGWSERIWRSMGIWESLPAAA
jgi:hypothetical protein